MFISQHSIWGQGMHLVVPRVVPTVPKRAIRKLLLTVRILTLSCCAVAYILLASKFLSYISLESLQQEYSALQLSMNDMSSSPPDPGLNASYSLSSDAILSTSPETLNTILSLWNVVHTLKSSTSHLSLKLASQRYQFMLMNYICWIWIEGVFGQHCQNIMDDRPSSPDWVCQLHDDVRSFLNGQSPNAVLNANKYLPNITCANGVYKYARRKNLYQTVVPTRQRETILRIMMETVSTWLGFPSMKSPSHDCFLFVHYLKKTFGDEALYLDGVWKAYTHIKTVVFSNRRMKTISHQHFENRILPVWKLQNLASPTSTEREILKSIGHLFDQFHTRSHSQELPQPLPVAGPSAPTPSASASRQNRSAAIRNTKSNLNQKGKGREEDGEFSSNDESASSESDDGSIYLP